MGYEATCLTRFCVVASTMLLQTQNMYETGSRVYLLLGVQTNYARYLKRQCCGCRYADDVRSVGIGFQIEARLKLAAIDSVEPSCRCRGPLGK